MYYVLYLFIPLKYGAVVPRNHLGKPQKNYGIFLVARPLRGSKGLATKKKDRFETLKKILEKNLWPLSLGGE